MLASAGFARHEVPELRVLELGRLPPKLSERGGLAGMAEAAMPFG